MYDIFCIKTEYKIHGAKYRLKLNSIKNIFTSIFFTKRLYLALAAVVFTFVISFSFQWLYPIANGLLLLVCVATVIDALLLFANKNGVEAQRKFTHQKLSNGDDNEVFLTIENNYSFTVNVEIIDELPEQFQYRNFSISKKLESSEYFENLSVQKIKYSLRPLARGEFHFGKIIVLATTLLGFVQRRFALGEKQMLPCYPSFLKLRQYEFMAISDRLIDAGVKKLRKIGHSTEFDHIKEYVIGNDIRTINWKATARKNQLMVNHFRDERAQQVYSIIDMGRVMKMPFEELSLLDYSINASLVLSHISYIKSDKPGLITFSNVIHQTVSADRKGNQLYRLQEALYNANTNFSESNYEILLSQVRTKINQRSLLLLFTNFETLSGLRRQIKYIKQIAKHHLVVVVLFENTELNDLLNKKATGTFDIYTQTIAKKFDYEKTQITYELQRLGIQCIYTKPQNLTVNTLNKYLELKARGMI